MRRKRLQNVQCTCLHYPLPYGVEDGDLPPKAPSFVTRVCGIGFHIRRFRFGQARRARSPEIAQAQGALQRVFGCPEMSAV